MEMENKVLKARFIGLAIAVCIGFAANTAVAALGSVPLTGSNPHVASNAMRSAAEIKASTVSQANSATPPANALYSVNVVTLNSGTVVREFVSTTSGNVFALTWQGPRVPNYKDILGIYSERYLRPMGTDLIRVGGVSQRSLNSPDLVVQSFGHFGGFHGCAYLPLEFPAGLTPSELQ
jgi:hypothetical protein